ncbi:hypothetical protein K2W90_00255 [Candidatus Babeliales bacterium]|nr:hypothetical protein [Candidatus Babeliales bacterium]
MKLRALSAVVIFSISVTGLHGFSREDLRKVHKISAIAATPSNLAEALSGNPVAGAQTLEDLSTGICNIVGAALENKEFVSQINELLAAFNQAKNGRNPGAGEGAFKGWDKETAKRVGVDVTAALIQQVATTFANTAIMKGLPEDNKRPLRRLSRALVGALIVSLIEGTSSVARGKLGVIYDNADESRGFFNDSDKYVEKYLLPFLNKFGANLAWELCGEAVARTTDEDPLRDLDLLSINELMNGVKKAEVRSIAKK